MAVRLLLRRFTMLPEGEYFRTRIFEAALDKNKIIPNLTGHGFHTTTQREGVTPIKMPSLSPTMQEGTIVKWLKNEGDKVEAGDVLCEIQTDKAVVALEIDEEGILAKILIAQDTPDVKVGKLIALMVGEDEDWKNVEVPKDVEGAIESETKNEQESAPKDTGAANESEPKENQEIGTSNVEQSSGNQDRLVGPSVKHLLAKYGLKANQISRNGPHGALLKGDVLAYAENNNLRAVEQSKVSQSSGLAQSASQTKKKTKESAASFVDKPVTSMRRTIAKRLLQSKNSIPHAYIVVEVSTTKMSNLRKRMQENGLKASVNDFVIKAISNALFKCPAVNVAWEGSELRRKGQVDISVAVATDSWLITPIVANVSQKDVLAISTEVKALAEKARQGKLQPHEFIGGSFTISNLGMFGVHHFSAIINPPQCAILAVGGISISLAEDKTPKPVTNFTLSYDASGISEEAAAAFMATLKSELENISEISMGLFDLEDRDLRMI